MLKISIRDFAELSKPKIGLLILVTTLLGFFTGSGKNIDWLSCLALSIGTLASCSGAAMLNNYIERDLDKLMERTRQRALPCGRVSPELVLALGLILLLLGVIILWFGCNLLTALISITTSFLYVLVYTPMKRLSTLNTLIGAVPGALPAAGGVVAATDQFNSAAVILFSLLFIWQMPHFFSIAWLCKEDYQKAGFRMLPSMEAGDELTVGQILAFSILLIPISLLPVLNGLNGLFYASGAVLAAVVMIKGGLSFARQRNPQTAKSVLRASLYYFPIILFFGVLDRLF